MSNREKYYLHNFQSSIQHLHYNINNINDRKNYISRSKNVNYNNDNYYNWEWDEILSMSYDKRKDRKEYYLQLEWHKTSIFFRECLKNDVDLIRIYLNYYGCTIDTTEFIPKYKRLFQCHWCYNFNCVSNEFPSKEEITPLMHAILYDDIHSVENLLNLGANVNFITTHFKMSPLLLACRIQNLQIIKLLLQRGADYNHCDLLNRTCLMHVVYKFCFYDKFNFFSSQKEKTKVIKILQHLLKEVETPLIISKRERLRNYTILHMCIKVNILPRELLLSYRNVIDDIVRNQKVRRRNSLKGVFMYHHHHHIINDNNDDDDDDDDEKINFLNYCISCVIWNGKKFLVLVMQSILNRNYNMDEISDACLILYFSFGDNRYYHFFRKYINKYSFCDIITNNFNNDEYQYSRSYFNNFALNFAERILLNVYTKRYVHSYAQLKFDDIISDSMSILKCNNIEIGSILWNNIFIIINKTLYHYDNKSALNITVEIVDILLHNYIEKDINKHYSNITSTTSRNFFNYYNTHYKRNFMYSIFNIMRTALICYDSDAKIKKTLNDKFKRILFLLLQHNKNNDFDIFFHVMQYVVENLTEYLQSIDNLNNILQLLNLLKSFNLPMDRISGDFCFMFRINSDDDDDDDFIRVSTPFELALLFVACYEKEIMGGEGLMMINVFEIFPASHRHNDFIHFFINNDAAYLDTKCATYFFDNFNCLKCFLPLVNSKRKENKTKLKFIAARAIKKYNVDYSILKGISKFLYNFVMII